MPYVLPFWRGQATRSLAAFLLLAVASPLAAVEIEGTIAQVEGDRITVDLVGDVVPVVGDPLRVVVDVPGIGPAKVGSGRVTEVQATRVVAVIDEASGTISARQSVRITSSGTPAPGTIATPTPAPPRPSSEGDSQSIATTEPLNTIHELSPLVSNPPPPIEVTSSLVGQSEQSRKIVRATLEAMPRLHLSRHPVDEEIGRRTIQEYLSQLDPDKLFYSDEDTEHFLGEGYRLADELRGGDLSLAYEFYRRFMERLAERIALGRAILASDLDFSIEEDLILRDPAERWPMDPIATYEIWRKWMKFHMLTHRAVGADWDEARRRTARTLDALVARMERVDDDDLRDSVLIALALAYDPHSTYLSAKAWEEQNAMLRQQMVGIGAQLAVVDGYLTVQHLVPDGPAERAGDLKSGDRIVGVGQGADGQIVDIVGMPLADAVAKIRGPAGSVVRLRVIPRGKFEAWIYSITRGNVDLARMETTRVSGDLVGGSAATTIGYVHMPLFYTDMAAMREGRSDYRSSARDLRPKLLEFGQHGVDVVVLDLRDNNGGTPEESIDTASLFLGAATVLQSRDYEGSVEHHFSERLAMAWNGPLMVLTNRVTAGGAEIVAAAIQDYRRGLIVGDPLTFGMGTLAQFYDVAAVVGQPLPQGSLGYLRATSMKLYRPTGPSIQQRGVVPHLVLPSTTSESPIGESQLRHALQADSVDAIRFTSLGHEISPSMRQTLDAHSKERRLASQYFQNLRAKENLAGNLSSANVVQLNEQAFLAQRESSTISSDGDTRKLPGIPSVTLDGYLREAFLIALDYAANVPQAAAGR